MLLRVKVTIIFLELRQLLVGGVVLRESLHGFTLIEGVVVKLHIEIILIC